MELLSDCQGVEGLLIQPLNDQVPGQQDSVELAVSTTTGPSQEGAVSFVLEPGTDATLRSLVQGGSRSVMGDCVLPIPK